MRYGDTMAEVAQAFSDLHRSIDDAVCDDTDYGQCMIAHHRRWTCSYCAAVNPDDEYKCRNCYAPREED